MEAAKGLPGVGMEPFLGRLRIKLREDAMRAYLTNLPMRIWLLLVAPAVVVGYPVVRIVVPAVARAVVPEVVRTVLHVI
ncbi:hypothetical protein SBA1_1030002 [Candidatus Sulfotelmatobacter kueseliae]|uniref:Uncharacterized protein n=1 Tax=Candidatus Sulfotelmatobacter kueseliae TaxID=2042962 RepID=A0A2U3JXK3_9BACT|nr:hypothetical protein SBA1_1030002 [Candidatus Sulfotelmatobacter kueseliae]